MDSTNLKMPSKIALWLLTLLCLGAVYYYQERMLFSDASWVIYNIINQKQLFIQEHRYGSFITQLFPLVGVELQLPLKTILILYSLSFNLFPLVVGLILYRQKQYEWVILLALYLCICVSESYYWTNNEVHQGIVWLCAAMGLMTRQIKLHSHSVGNYILFGLVAFLAIFAHPILIIISIYTFVMIAFSFRKQVRLSFLTPYAILLAVLILGKYYLSQHGWYDQTKLESIHNISSFQSIIQTLHSATAQNFFQNCLSRYIQFTVLFLSGLFIMLAQKRYLQLLWTILFMAAYFLCISIVYPTCDNFFYIESEWMPISVMGVWALSFWGLTQLNSRIASLLLVVVFGIQIIHINNNAAKFTKRITCLKSIINQPKIQQAQKILIGPLSENDSLRKTLLMDWGLPIETLIYSSIETPQHMVSVRIVDSNELKQLTTPLLPKMFINPFYTEKYNKHNAQYFKLDSNTQYVVIDSSTKLNLSF
jgi:hypothetical protein